MTTDDVLTWALVYLIVGALFAIASVVSGVKRKIALDVDLAVVVVFFWPPILILLVLALIDGWTRGELANLSSQTERNRSKRQRRRNR